jgi:hypothetical protein
MALHGSLPKKIVKPLIELSAFCRVICLKTLIEEDLARHKAEIPIILHVVIHLVRECRFGGPVHYRWMYPVEK